MNHKIAAAIQLSSSLHRDLTWNLNDYIVSLRSELRSWRKVYWRLWGDCHFLYCRECETFFPIHQMDWCSYHPEIPQFFANEQLRNSPFPLGRYPCCSQRAYRFEAFPNKEGCRFKVNLVNFIKKYPVAKIPIFYYSYTRFYLVLYTLVYKYQFVRRVVRG